MIRRCLRESDRLCRRLQRQGVKRYQAAECGPFVGPHSAAILVSWSETFASTSLLVEELHNAGVEAVIGADDLDTALRKGLEQ